MKKTALHAIHQQLGAKMVPFGGFEMPVSYRSIKEEHHCVRNGVGVFDVSHMGEFFVKGPQALPLLQHLCSNDIAQLVPGKAQYNYLPNRTGGVVDDLIVYQLAEENYLMVVNAANIAKDWAWVEAINADFGAQLTNASNDYSLLAVQGPKALGVVQQLATADLSALPFYAHCTTSVAGFDNCIVATTGYTGSGPPSFTAITISLPMRVKVLAIADQRFIFRAFRNSKALPISTSNVHIGYKYNNLFSEGQFQLTLVNDSKK